MQQNYQKGITLIEFLIVFFIFAILLTIVVASFRSFQTQSGLDKNTQAVIQFFRLARNQALASKNDLPAGVHLETNKLVIFEGSTYNAADPNNQLLNLDNDISITEINFSPASTTVDVVFAKVTGFTDNNGHLKLESTKDPSQSQSIYIEPSGQVSLISAVVTSNNYQDDPRHIHFNFVRPINTATEKIYLFFDDSGTSQQTINLTENLSGGQIDWSGTIDINGSPQTIRIHTHNLNTPNSVICVHRDRRPNNKSLKIDLETDNLVNYAATGELTQGNSIWVDSPIIQ